MRLKRERCVLRERMRDTKHKEREKYEEGKRKEEGRAKYSQKEHEHFSKELYVMCLRPKLSCDV